jgi:hypothetical protein
MILQVVLGANLFGGAPCGFEWCREVWIRVVLRGANSRGAVGCVFVRKSMFIALIGWWHIAYAVTLPLTSHFPGLAPNIRKNVDWPPFNPFSPRAVPAQSLIIYFIRGIQERDSF